MTEIHLLLIQLLIMFVLSSLSVLVALSSCVYGSPTFGSSGHETRIVEKIASAPAGWTKDESIQLDKDGLMMKLRIHLVPQDMNKFHDLAMNVRMPHEKLAQANDIRLRHLDIPCMANISLKKSSMPWSLPRMLQENLSSNG